MEKIHTKLYLLWVMVSTIACVFLLRALYPDYENNEFPLFTDITLVIFLPSLFIFSSILLHLLTVILGNVVSVSYRQSLIIQIAFMIMTFLFSLSFMEFSFGIKLAVSSLSFIVAIPHFMITKALYQKMKH